MKNSRNWGSVTEMIYCKSWKDTHAHTQWRTNLTQSSRNKRACSWTWNPLIAVMTTELGVCLNKMPPLSRRLLAVSEHRDLPPPLSPLLSPATNQVCQTTFGQGQENGCQLSAKKETEEVQSHKKRLTLCSRSHRAEAFVLSLSLWMLCQCQRLALGMRACHCLCSAHSKGVSRCPRKVLMHCVSQWEMRQILSTRQCCQARMQSFVATQGECSLYMGIVDIMIVSSRTTYSNCDITGTSQAVKFLNDQ